jgi:uncharacterized repeat protein (TIGR01451 family)
MIQHSKNQRLLLLRHLAALVNRSGNAVRNASALFFLIVALSFAGTVWATPTLTLALSNDAAPTLLSGEPIIYTLTYSASGLTAPGYIVIQDIFPAGLDVDGTAGISGSIGVASIYHNKVTFNIPNTLGSVTGVVQVVAHFLYGSTCNGATSCDTARIAVGQLTASNSTIASSINPDPAPSGEWLFSNASCATAHASFNWTIEKSVVFGSAVDDDVTYRLAIFIPGNKYGQLDVTSCNISEHLPTGAFPDPYTPGHYLIDNNSNVVNGANLTGNATTNVWQFTFQSGSALNVTGGAGLWYIYYYRVKYPSPTFQAGQTIIDTISMTAHYACDGGKTNTVTDTAKVVLTAGVSSGALNKWFNMGVGYPNNPYWYPSISSGCCGTYYINYNNTGTLTQTGVVITDNLPPTVDASVVRTAFVPGLTGCVISYTASSGPTPPSVTLTNSTNAPQTTVISGLAANARVTQVKWTYSGSLAPGSGLTIYNPNSLDVCFNSSVVTGTTIVNTAIATATGLAQPLTSINTLTGSARGPKILLDKGFLGGTGCPAISGPSLPGNIVRVRIAVANAGNQSATTCILQDILPGGANQMTYVGNPTYKWITTGIITGNTPSCSNMDASVNTDVINHIGPTYTEPMPGATTLVWKFSKLPQECDGMLSWLVIDFDVKIPDVPPMPIGTYSNTFSFKCDGVASQVSDPALVTVIGASKMEVTKLVRKRPNGVFASDAHLQAGDQAEYQLQILNSGNNGLTNFSLMDILPHVGDTRVLPLYTARGSLFGVPFIPANGSISISDALGLPVTGYTTNYYTNSTLNSTLNPSRSGYCGVTDPPGITPGVWSATPSPTYSISVLANAGTVLAGGATLNVTIPFIVPVSNKLGDSACNTFAAQAKPVGSPDVCLKFETSAACIFTTVDSAHCTPLCDTAYYGVAASQVVNCIGCYPNNTDWRSINIVNREGNPIHTVQISYFDCNGNRITNFSQLSCRNLHVIRFAPLTNRTLSASHYPSPYTVLNGLNQAPSLSNQNLVTFDLSLPCNATPNGWSIRLMIEHQETTAPFRLDTCYINLPCWNPCPRVIRIPTWRAVMVDSPIYVSSLALDEGVAGQVGFVTLATLDSTDYILGGNGIDWAGALLSTDSQVDTKPSRLASFEHARNGVLYKIASDTSATILPTFNVFVGAGKHGQDSKYRPTIIVGAYDQLGGLLTTDTVLVRNTTSSVQRLGASQPEPDDLEITSITPNPAHTSIDVEYMLGASEQAKLEIFNTLGVQVGVLADGYQNIGKHTAHFIVNALAGGSYYLRLSTYNRQTSATVKVVN